MPTGFSCQGARIISDWSRVSKVDKNTRDFWHACVHGKQTVESNKRGKSLRLKSSTNNLDGRDFSIIRFLYLCA